MDDPNITNKPGSYQNIESTFLTIEEIWNSEKSAIEKSTAWRQQLLLMTTFSDNNCNDLLERHCYRRRESNVDSSHNLDKHLEVIQSLVGGGETFQNNIKFPNIDEIVPTIPKDNNMFGQLCRSSIRPIQSTSETTKNTQKQIARPTPVNQTTSDIEEGRISKPRNTMQNFLNQSSSRSPDAFCMARQLLAVQTMKKNMQSTGMMASQGVTNENNQENQGAGFNFAATKKSLGSLGRIVNSSRKSFVSPARSKTSVTKDMEARNENIEENIDPEMASLMAHPALKNVDCQMVEKINNEIIHKFKAVDWDEIAGLDYAKSIIKEAVVYPLLRPDIFTGLRRPPRGILLFGPPGTGKTLIGKCIASQSSSTFFSISSASLTSKWMGEGEKMVRALFAVAVARQPSVIFIDEVDSLLCQRSDKENEGTRRLKTEFLVRLDGASTSDDDRVLIVGATNRPQELDEAVRRRFIKRIYVPLPEMDARTKILMNLLQTVDNNLNPNELKEISELAAGYSGADMDSLCREAAMEPLRSLPAESIISFKKENLRPVNVHDFHSALKKIRPSVSQTDLYQYVEWNKTYGSSY